MHIDVSFTPHSLTQKKVEGRQVVAIDVLRASSTMVTALANGARGIVPVSEPSQAVEVRAKLGTENALLGGERNCVKIENFDLGASPLEYSPGVVTGKTIAMSTTNGTRLFTMFRYSGAVWVGCFLNLGAICKAVAGDGADVALLCAGSDGDFSTEDTLCAGAVIDGLADRYAGELSLNDSAKLALLHYNANREWLLEAFMGGEHGRRLIQLGFQTDIAFAARIDRYGIAPLFSSGQIALPETAFLAN
ncbi:MAG: 2-phosphosulfolactate phosphatase [Candidatus Zixiibacteriota bacterium]